MYSISHRALVTYSDQLTGEIRVKIPAVSGASEVSISKVGRRKFNDIWVVPQVGETIVVSADDPMMTNIFWLHTDSWVNTTSFRNYGSFHDKTTQNSLGVNIATPMQFRTTDAASGITTTTFGTRIQVSYTGVYNFQFSAQLDKTDSGEDHVFIWIRKNNVDVPWTNTQLTMSKNNIKLVAAWNFVLPMNAGDYASIYWLSDDITMCLYAQPASTSPAMPGIPSTILTVTQVA